MTPATAPRKLCSSWAFQKGVKKLGRIQEEAIKLNYGLPLDERKEELMLESGEVIT